MRHRLHTRKLHQAVKEATSAQAWARKEFNTEFIKRDLYFEVSFKLSDIGQALKSYRNRTK